MLIYFNLSTFILSRDTIIVIKNLNNKGQGLKRVAQALLVQVYRRGDLVPQNLYTGRSGSLLELRGSCQPKPLKDTTNKK